MSVLPKIEIRNNVLYSDGRGLTYTEEDLRLLEELLLSQSHVLSRAIMKNRETMGPHESALWLMHLGSMEEVIDQSPYPAAWHAVDANGYAIREPYALAVQFAQKEGWYVVVRLSSNVFRGERGMYLTISI